MYEINLNVKLILNKPYVSWVEMVLLQGLNANESVEVTVLSQELTELEGSL